MIAQLMNGFQTHHKNVAQKRFKNKEGIIATDKKQNYRAVENHWNTVFNRHATYDEKIIDEIEQHPVQESLGFTPE